MNKIEILRKLQNKEITVEQARHIIIKDQPEKIVDTETVFHKKRKTATQPIISNSENAKPMEIAIVGISGRYPQSPNLDALWENLKGGKNCVSEVPSDRWDVDAYYAKEKAPGKSYTKWGGFIQNVDHFDPLFFKISHNEAIILDPQERLFLQEAWKVFEDAGFLGTALFHKQEMSANVGVFVGVMNADYQLVGGQNWMKGKSTGSSSFWSIANRVSYLFDFSGPSLAIDTACSSSLTAVHYACESLSKGECEQALVGGVNLILHPSRQITLCQLNMLSKGSKCHSFGAHGDGFVQGEGVGAILLKPLKQAIEDQDCIKAVISATAINHGGKTGGYMVPNPNAQGKLIKSAWERSGLIPGPNTYIESHGTGTPLGDPIEIAGLNKAFESFNTDKQSISLGSVKSNIGHLEAAAGIAALSKIVLQLKHKKLVPTINSDPPNTNIDFDASVVKLNQALREWKSEDAGSEEPLSAGVSSFGAGGTNVHIVVREYRDAYKKSEKVSERQRVDISAKTKKDLGRYIKKYQDFINKKEGLPSFEDFAYTSRVGRESMKYGDSFLAGSYKELSKKIATFLESDGSFIDKDLENTTSNKIKKRDPNYSIVSIPTYPFKEDPYWVPKEQQNSPLSKPDLKPELQLQPEAQSPEQGKYLGEKVLNYLIEVVSKETGIPTEEFDALESFDAYGLESIMIGNIHQKLVKDLGDISPSIFFSCRNIEDIKEELLEFHNEGLINYFSIESERELCPQPTTVQVNELQKVDALFENNTCPMDIAIIGIAGQYPNATSLDEFWDNIKNGQDCVVEVPNERWDYREYIAPEKGGVYCKWGGFLENYDEFDPLFFNISPNEAKLIDPQERLFIQTVYSTLEDAGYPRQYFLNQSKASENLNVGVFVGISFNTYQMIGSKKWHEGTPSIVNFQNFSVANRISYLFNFHGPSMPIDTACSSSLVSVHMACESIRRNECKMAVAGGVNLTLHPSKYYTLCLGGFASKSGRCKVFGEGADGYVPGEGVGAILLKPLENAIKDKDHIYGVIKGSSINHGGRTNGYTVPSPESQKEVIIKAHEKSNIDPKTISYIEAHGTGTALGDPIEIAGLTKAFKTSEAQYCSIGSVKSNIGHLESAAGIAQITKVLLQMKHQKLVPTLTHSDKLNTSISFSKTPFFVQESLTDWRPKFGESLRAGISSFGAGGTNAHLILESFKNTTNTSSKSGEELFLFSANDCEDLEKILKNFVHYVNQNRHLRQEDIAATLQEGRDVFSVRLAIVAHSKEALIEVINSWINNGEVSEKLFFNIIEHKKKAELINNNDSLLTIAKEWVQGSKLNKELSSGQRISLPGYVFKKDKYWIDDHRNDSRIADWTYIWKWEEISQEIVKEASQIAGSWVFIGDDIDNKLTEHLKPNIHEILSFSEVTLEKIEMLRQPNMPMNIVVFWGRNTGSFKSLIKQKEIFRIALLLSTLSKSLNNDLALFWITRNSYSLPDCPSKEIDLDNTTIWGIANVFFSEHNDSLKGILDLDLVQDPEFESKVIQALILGELKETHLVLRRHKIWVPRFTSIEVEKSKKPLIFEKEKYILITGGLGELGEEISKWVVKNKGQKLLLLGRSALDSRPEYQEKIAHLEKLGCEVKYINADVANESEVRLGLTPYLGQIDTIFHLAGVTSDSIPISEMSFELYERVLSSKMMGAWVLHQVFKDQEIKRFILFSSVSSLPGMAPYGLSAYSAANMFLDQIIGLREALGLPGISINWTSWEEIGMGKRHNNVEILKSMGVEPIPTSTALDILGRVLDTDKRNVVIYKANWKEAAKLNGWFSKNKQYENIVPLADLTSISEKVSSDQVLPIITEIVETLMGVPASKIDSGRSFSDYGFDSIMGMKLLSQMNQRFSLNLSPTALFNYATIDALVVHIKASIDDQEKKQSKSSHIVKKERSELDSIGIIGIGCRLPEIDTVSMFWEALLQKQKTIRPFPESRIKLLNIEKTDEIQKIEGGYLEGVECFDPELFGISNREAVQMDPQQRILLEVCRNAITDAGISSEEIHGSSTGVYIGMYPSQYGYLNKTGASLDALHAMTGNSTSIAANRISYCFNLRGPSLVVDTACSSSLVALHQAIQAIKNGECEQAIVAGINLHLLPFVNALLTEAQMLSPDSKCHSFDKNANGYVQGEGAFSLFIKPAHKIVKADRVYAMIKGSAINQDGKTNGITAPNGGSQEEVLKQAHKNAGVESDLIQLFETHGTGTFLGDPIEANAIGAIISNNKTLDARYLGALKSNIGHLEPAAGLAGVAKAALSIFYKKIPANLNFNVPNPHIEFEKPSFKVPTKIMDWPTNRDKKLYAGVSSFGLGGTNAHVVLESFEQNSMINNIDYPYYLLTFSAKSFESLREYIKKLQLFLDKTDVLLRDLSATLAAINSNYSARVSIITEGSDSLKESLEKVLRGEPDKLVAWNSDSHAVEAYLPEKVIEDVSQNMEKEKYLERLLLLSDAYLKGWNFDWGEVFRNYEFRKISIPGYAFQKNKYWIENVLDLTQTEGEKKEDLLESRRESNIFNIQQIQSPLKTIQYSFEVDSKIFSEISDTNYIVHIGIYIEVLATIIQKVTGKFTAFNIARMVFNSAIIVVPDGVCSCMVTLTPLANTIYQFEFYTQHKVGNEEEWVSHSQGEVYKEDSENTVLHFSKTIKSSGRHLSRKDFYSNIKEMGMPVGQTIRWVRDLWLKKRTLWGEFQNNSGEDRYVLGVHPGIFDACLQPLFALLPKEIDNPYMTIEINNLKVNKLVGEKLLYKAKMHTQKNYNNKIKGEWALFSLSGELYVKAEKVVLKALNAKRAVKLQKEIETKKQTSNNEFSRCSEKEVLQILKEKISVVLSCSPDRIVVNETIWNLGMDSLMIMEFKKSVEQDLNNELPTRLFIEGANLESIAKVILNSSDPVKEDAQVKDSIWIKRKTITAPKHRLFCFPYGGKGASLFSTWQDMIDSSIEVCSVQLPGRENRIEERPFELLLPLIEQLSKEILPYLDIPFSFYGHSVGSLIGFELARTLKKNHGIQPSFLIPGAYTPPHMPNTNLKITEEKMRKAGFETLPRFGEVSTDSLKQLRDHLMSSQDIRNRIGVHWENIRDLMSDMLPTMMADLYLVKSYEYTESPKLSCPIVAMGGKKDSGVEEEELKAWKNLTTGTFSCQFFSGDHTFLHSDQNEKEVVEAIAKLLV